MPWDATCLQVQVWHRSLRREIRLECWLGDKLKNMRYFIAFQDRKGTEGSTRKEGWGVIEEQKRRSPPALVIGLPRLSFPRDQSHRNCLLPDCGTNQLSYRPLISSLSPSLSLSMLVKVFVQRHLLQW